MSFFKSRRGAHGIKLDEVLQKEERFILDRRHDAGFNGERAASAAAGVSNAAANGSPTNGHASHGARKNGASPNDAATSVASNGSATRDEAAPTASPVPTVGLALSGGGIRSASLSLGLIQSLRKHGLFRYVDYLSAISGGSYTGALVASSFYRATGQSAGPKGAQECPLDIDLQNETVQPGRVRALMSDGRYLIRPLEWANRFFSGWLALLLVAVSGLLAASALVAFVWRSMDYYIVRDYLNELGLASDLWSGLLPVILVFILWVICWIISYAINKESAKGLRAKRMLIVLVLMSIATVAGLLGNGDIALTDGGLWKASSNLKMPLIASILGGLLPIFFRDRLFKSGAIESSFWEKIVYRYTAIAVVIGIPMLTIGYFARENVSSYSTSRDGRLLWGDIKDFSTFSNWFQSLTKQPSLSAPTRDNSLNEASGGKSPDGALASLTAPPSEDRSEPTQAVDLILDVAPNAIIVDVHPLLAKIDKLTNAHRELRARVGGAQKWRQPPRVPETILSLDEDGGDDPTEVVATDSKGRQQESSRLPANAIVSKITDSQGVAKADPLDVIPYEPAATTPSSWDDWLRWQYSWLGRRVSLLTGHIFHGDSDDPLGLAIEANRRLIDSQTRLITLFNERFLADRDFSERLVQDLPPQPSIGGEYPEEFRSQVARLREAGAVAFGPEELIEFNRSLLEAARPDLIRRRDELRRTNVIHADQVHRLTWFAVFGVIFLGSMYFINPNATSIQRYYQERLAAAYLGGSDEDHNMRLTDMAPRMRPGPMLIVGGATNYRFRPANKDQSPDLVDQSQPLRPANKDQSPDLVDQSQPLELTDRIGHFEFSPFYCGSPDLGYVPTESYCNGRLRLADAVAISGAALNPMYFDRWEMLVIFGLLNLRMGQWLPNPARGTTSLTPTFARIFSDIFNVRERRITRASERRHILLTDGGHFDNTGVQALLERQCKIIIVCDATQDEHYRFDDLAMLIGRMKGKKGIVLCEIGSSREIDLAARATRMKEKGAHFFCAEIRYSRDPAGSNSGLLIYFKSSLTGDEPPYIWNHAQKNPCFPHDSTINQSYGFEQFCAYLGLGQHMVDDLVAGRERAVEEVGTAEEFKFREFAALFLGEIDERRRNEFLDRLFMGPLSEDARQAVASYRRIERRFREAVKAGDWSKLELAANDLRQGVLENRSFPKCLLGLPLDLLADGMAAVEDPVARAGERALSNSAGLFLEILEAKCKELYRGSVNAASRHRYMASEIRSRFHAPERCRAVRWVVRQGRKSTLGFFGWTEHLVCDGDSRRDGVVAEVLNELGDLCANSDRADVKDFQRLLKKCRFSSSEAVRKLTDRLDEMLSKKAIARKSAVKNRPIKKLVGKKSILKKPPGNKAPGEQPPNDVPPPE